MAGDVFLSYSRADRSYVEQLAAHLAAAGLPVWHDYEIDTGDRFDARIKREIESCAVFLPVLTPASVGSEWVELEISYAHMLRKQIRPLLLAPCQLPFLIHNLQYEDVTDGLLPPDRFIDQLRGLVVAYLAGVDRTQALAILGTMDPDQAATLLAAMDPVHIAGMIGAAAAELSRARAEGEGIVAEARAEADGVRERVGAEADGVRERVGAEADGVRERAEAEAARILAEATEQAQVEAESIVAKAEGKRQRSRADADKIRADADKIRADADKIRADAEKVLADARTEAERILATARKEAEKITADARTKAAPTKPVTPTKAAPVIQPTRAPARPFKWVPTVGQEGFLLDQPRLRRKESPPVPPSFSVESGGYEKAAVDAYIRQAREVLASGGSFLPPVPAFRLAFFRGYNVKEVHDYLAKLRAWRKPTT